MKDTDSELISLANKATYSNYLDYNDFVNTLNSQWIAGKNGYLYDLEPSKSQLQYVLDSSRNFFYVGNEKEPIKQEDVDIIKSVLKQIAKGYLPHTNIGED